MNGNKLGGAGVLVVLDDDGESDDRKADVENGFSRRQCAGMGVPGGMGDRVCVFVWSGDGVCARVDGMDGRVGASPVVGEGTDDAGDEWVREVTEDDLGR